MATPLLSLDTTAASLFETIETLPIVSPHGHCDPNWFSGDAPFSDPAALLVTPDHYVFRMLYSHGVSLESLGIGPDAEPDPRAVFRRFAAHWSLFLGTPSALWISHTLRTLFGVDETLSAANADAVYDQIDRALAQPDFRPTALMTRLGIDVLATTDGALDDLAAHATVAEKNPAWRMVPTFRPDSVLNPGHLHFQRDIERLGAVTDIDISSVQGWCDALRQRRAFFKSHGATATDHDVPKLHTEVLSDTEADSLFSQVRAGTADAVAVLRLHGHMLIQMALMSCDDRLVMQIHAGSTRSTNQTVQARFGPDMGADIPHRTDWVSGLNALLNVAGNNPAFRVIAFTLDESSYARELAPMAGHWPAMRLGPPWWFHDSPQGIERYFDRVVETAGYGNLAGFNDDTRAFLSIPARHDMWRRCVARHLSIQMQRGHFGREDAEALAHRLAIGLALESYRLDSTNAEAMA